MAASDGNRDKPELRRPARPGLARWLLACIGPAILLLILTTIDVGEVGRVLTQASVGACVAAYLAAIPAILLRALRLRLVLGRDVGRPKFVEVTHVYAYSLFIGTITPGRLGEFIKLIQLKRWGANPGSGLATVLLERIPDVMFLLVVGAVALAVFAFPGMSSSTVLVLAVAAPVAAIALFWVLLGPGTRGVLRGLLAVAPRRFARKLRDTLDGFVAAVAGLKRTALVGVFTVTLAAWALNYLSNYLFALSLGIDLSYLEIAGISAICSLIFLVPISIMGAGTRDAALIVMLAHYQIPETRAVAFSTLLLSFFVFNALVCSYSLATPAARFAGRADEGR